MVVGLLRRYHRPIGTHTESGFFHTIPSSWRGIVIVIGSVGDESRIPPSPFSHYERWRCLVSLYLALSLISCSSLDLNFSYGIVCGLHPLRKRAASLINAAFVFKRYLSRIEGMGIY